MKVVLDITVNGVHDRYYFCVIMTHYVHGVLYLLLVTCLFLLLSPIKFKVISSRKHTDGQ